MEDDKDKWFIENFHIFFDKKYLEQVNKYVNGSPGLPFNLKIDHVLMDDNEYSTRHEDYLYSLLCEEIMDCYPNKKGGGLSLGKLKEDIRRKVSIIKPRNA